MTGGVIHASAMTSVLIWFWLPFVLACFYALWRGGGPERWAAGLLVAAALATLAVKPSSGRYLRADDAIVVVDLVLLVSLLLLSTRASRAWPIALTVLHGITSLGHLSRSVNPDIRGLAYWLILAPPEVAGLAVLALGTWRHRRRLRRLGTDPSWKP